MREIKFRVYSKDYGMSAPRTLKEFCLNTGNRFLELKDLVVMQYTGLKDKNGVEIYEGDIISYKGRFCGCKVNLYSEIVEFNPVGGYTPWSLEDDEGIFSIKEETIKVIGNIYENPELLKDTNESDKI